MKRFILLIATLIFLIPFPACSTETFDLKITYFEPPTWVTGSFIQFYTFSSSGNLWPNFNPFTDTHNYEYHSSSINPGINTFKFSPHTNGEDGLYLAIYGGYLGRPPYAIDDIFESHFSAEPPSGVFNEDVYNYGPAWIALANLSPNTPLYGDLETFFGWGWSSLVVGSWELSEVPEPSTIFLCLLGLLILTTSRLKFVLRFFQRELKP